MVKKKKNSKEQMSEEEKAQKDKRKIDRFLSKSAHKIMQDNPDVLRTVVGKTFNFNIPTIEESSMSKLLAHIDELLIKDIENNPSLKRDILDARIAQLMEGFGTVKVGEEWRRKPPTLDDWIMQFEKFNLFQETIGIKPKGILQELASPEIINPFLMTIVELLKARQAGPSEETKIPVQIDGKNVTITIEEYKQLAAKGRIQVIADIGSEPTDNPGNGNGSGEADQIPDDKKDETKAEDTQ